MIDPARFDKVRASWREITDLPPETEGRFAAVKREADGLVSAGLWTSGPQDLLAVIRRHRDEMIHSRLIAWLMVPTNRHALGRGFITGFADLLWPGENLFRTGTIVVETEVPGSGLDDSGRLRQARADIVIRGASVMIVIENKVGAGEQPAQCERLYWAWANEPGDTRWVFLSPSGRPPQTAKDEPVKSAWRAMRYRDLRDIFETAMIGAATSESVGRSTAAQYLATMGAM